MAQLTQSVTEAKPEADAEADAGRRQGKEDGKEERHHYHCQRHCVIKRDAQQPESQMSLRDRRRRREGCATQTGK